MCCSFDIKKKLMLFFCICFSSLSLSYADETVTQTPSTPSSSAPLSPGASSWFAQGFARLMLISTGAQALAVPYTAPLGQQPHLSLNPVHLDGAITGLCYSFCTQECAPQLMLFNALVDTTTYCALPVKQADAFTPPPPKKKQVIYEPPWCPELSIGEFSAVSDQTSTGTTVHFSIHPKENFSLQNLSLSCRIGNTQISKDLSEARLVITKKDSIERQRRQTNTCTPDANNRVYLGQNNLTRCLEQNNGAAFFFVENIDFSQLPLEEQNRFPLYPTSNPFSGNLTMPPFSLNNFNIMRKNNADVAFFIAINNSIINANFSNANVQSENFAAILAVGIYGHNTILLAVDSANITSAFYSGGVAAIATENSSGAIILRIKDKATITRGVTSFVGAAGVAIGYINQYSNYNITILGNEISIICNRVLACGGVIGHIERGNSNSNSNSNSNYFIKTDINVIEISSGRLASENIGIITGRIDMHNNIKIDSNINHIMIRNGSYAGSLGQLISSPQSHTLIIRNTQVDLQATEANALGVARASSGQKSPTILLLSGNGTLAAPNHLLFPGGSCAESLIDLSGISFNTMNVGCANASLVESITASGWRTANSRLAAELCADDPHACHYVNELPLAFVQGEGHTFFLVSQQTHPYNNTITGQGPIRVTQWNWDNVNSVPRINSDFAVNGTQIHPANGQILPNSSPISVAIDHDTLLVLFQETSTQLISMPLTTQHDTHYQIHSLDLNAAPVQLEGKDLWVQNNNQLLRRSVFPNVGHPSFSITLETNDPVVGVAQAGNYTYAAYTSSSDNTNTVRVLRFLANGTQDNRWEATLPEHNLYRYRQLKVGGTEENPVFNLPSVTETIHSESIDGDTATVLLPPKGGYGHWLYGKTHMSQSFIKPYIDPTSATEDTTTSTDGNSSGSGESDNGDAGTESSNNSAVAAVILIPMALLATAGGVGTCVVLHKKKIGCMLKLEARVTSQFNTLKCRTHQSKHSDANTKKNDETTM